MNRKHSSLRYFSHRGRKQHPISLFHRVSISFLLPIALVVVAGVIATGSVVIPSSYSVEAGTLLAALGASMLRLLVSYVISLVVGVALGLMAEYGKRVESALLPVFDVLESLPVLAFFPVIIILFLRVGLLEGAAIFIIFFSMVWNIAFSVVSGLKQTPEDVKAVGKVFGLSKWQRLRKILLPAIFPPVLTGSILALADGWNIVIVAEALSVYAPHATAAHDLFGIGSILVKASTNGDTNTLIAAIGLLVVVIALINIVIWQPLLAHAERYKFE